MTKNTSSIRESMRNISKKDREKWDQKMSEPVENNATAADGYALALELIRWAKTPGNHGGNPYGHKFMAMAQALVAKAEGK